MKNNDTNYSTNFNTKAKVSRYNQRPLKINPNNNNENINYEEQMKKIYEERQKIQNRIQKLDEEENKNASNNENIELRQAQLSYCKDPFKYMDYLLEEYFKKVYNENYDEEKAKKKVEKDFEKLQNDLIEDFEIFKNRQKVYFERIQDKYYVINRKKENLNMLDENAELQSEPLYQGENIKHIFNQLPQNKYNLIINSTGDTKNELINDKNSKFYKNKLCRGVLQCMGNENQNFKPPEKKFLEVNNIKKNLEFYLDGKRYFNLKREKEKMEKDCEANIIDNQEKTINVQNKLFDMKCQNYFNDIDEYKNKNEEYFKYLNDIKDQMTKDNLFGKLTQKQLNIFKKSKEEIKDILTQKNGDFEGLFNKDNNLCDENGKINEEYYNELMETNMKFENDLKNINNEINNIKNKYGFRDRGKSGAKMKKANNKKRNNSSYIRNRKYYNDNPFHYEYRYDGASIPIKKKLNKFPDVNSNY